jgi:molybdate-binding protein/DNA-binding XRE family transcriptional regulator
LRQARGWTQAELGQAAGLSRTGVCAIEAERLVPSVAAAIGLARALECSVEDLFGPVRRSGEVAFAWPPATFPCRYWAAEVAGRTLLFPVESEARSGLMHDGIARHLDDLPKQLEAAKTTLVVATCDPAADYLAAAYRRHGGLRMVVLSRSSSEAVALVERGVAHVAGVHLAAAGAQGGNAAAIGQRSDGPDLALLHVAQWEEGIASQPATRVRSATAAARGKLRWVGRPAGAGARRCQDELLGSRRAPRHVARDHRGVVEAVRGGWADVGVCVRLACEEGQLAFLPVGKESYDVCFRRDQAADPRIAALIHAVRSVGYRRLLTELPGYEPQSHLGEVEHVSSAK